MYCRTSLVGLYERATRRHRAHPRLAVNACAATGRLHRSGDIAGVPLFDERNPAVKLLVAQVIATAKRCGRKIGICGQAPSDYPDFAAFLVEQGIDSISLTPDVILKTTLSILEMEQRMKLQ